MAIFTSVKELVEVFNRTIPGAPRPITEADVVLLCELKLIRKNPRYFASDDVQTVLSILTFIKWCEGRVTTEGEPTKPPTGPRLCKKCHKKLKKRALSTLGRPKIYCPNCYLNRRRDRNKPKAIEQAF